LSHCSLFSVSLCSLSNTWCEMLIVEPGQVEDPGSHCKYSPAPTARRASSARTPGPCARSAGLLVQAPKDPWQGQGQGQGQGCSPRDMLGLESRKGEARAGPPCVHTVPNRSDVGVGGCPERWD
jgi:hypothetical protein